MYTHICIETGIYKGKPINEIYPGAIKKGDFCTIVSTFSCSAVTGGIAMTFKEGPSNIKYAAYLFLPLPPQKTNYVAVSEEVVKKLPEPVLN